MSFPCLQSANVTAIYLWAYSQPLRQRTSIECLISFNLTYYRYDTKLYLQSSHIDRNIIFIIIIKFFVIINIIPINNDEMVLQIYITASDRHVERDAE